MVELQTRGQSSRGLDLVFHALADETRRALVLQLARTPACTVTELAAPYAMSLAAVSKHIQVLERAGVVSKTREGRRQRCRLNPKPLEEVSTLLDAYRTFWERQLDALELYLQSEATTKGSRRPRRDKK